MRKHIPRRQHLPFVERRAWLISTIGVASVDVDNKDFERYYAKHTLAPYRRDGRGQLVLMMLRKDLLKMWQAGDLERRAMGLKTKDYVVGTGRPIWVWSYTLAKHLRPK